MDRKQIQELVDDPRFIPLIHNYCDRWCERCYLSSRCSVYAMAQEEDADPAAQDPDNQAFWNSLHEHFQSMLDMVAEHAEEMGIELDPTNEEYEQWLDDEERRRKNTKSHPLFQAAERYWQMVDHWRDAHRDLFEEKQQSLSTAVRLHPESLDPDIEAASILDAVQVVRWYQHFISAKIYRALRADPEMDAILADMPRDCDGSAKIALIAIDRSIAAWGVLREALGDADDSILDLLIHLDRLRRATEVAFPQARDFVRPGFDEEAAPAPRKE